MLGTLPVFKRGAYGKRAACGSASSLSFAPFFTAFPTGCEPRPRLGRDFSRPELQRADKNDVAQEASLTEGVAGRYAGALFDLAKEQGQVAQVEQDLGTFQKLIEESADLRRMLRSPVIAADEQAKALAALVAKAGIGGLAGNFLALIARNRRLFAAPDMIRAFQALAARARGEVPAEVTSAVALTEAQLTELKATLKASVGKDVQLKTSVDPSLLGGLMVKIGSRMIDSSLRTKLAGLKSVLKATG